MDGFVRERSGAALPGIVPSNTYRARDDKYVVIGANADSIFKRMMRGHRPQPTSPNDPGARPQRRPRRAHRGDREGDRRLGRGARLDQVLAVLERAEVPSGKIFASPTSPATRTSRRAE